MRASKLLLAATLCCVATLAQAAGFRFIEVAADASGPALKGAVWYPCAAAPGEVDLGPVTLPAVKNCPVEGEKLPLVVISHGRGGWFAGHHDTAETLADAGFVVAAISHAGDTGRDMSRTGDLSILKQRPSDIKKLIDHMLGAWPEAARIDRERIGFFGFSRGGYTGLVVIGGNPDLRKGLALCPEGVRFRMCEQLRADEIPAGPFAHDPRIKAAVIADPAFGLLFDREALKDATVPVALWASAIGGDGVTPESIAAIGQNLPAKPEYRVVKNSGHFAFLAPCSPGQAKAAPEICVDAPDFDRVAFHKELDAEAVAFFRAHLGEGRQP